MAKCECPVCHEKTDGFMHTSDVIRALGRELEWKNFAVCDDCFVVIDLTYQITAKQLGVALPRDKGEK
jgi:hypothetical protein